MSKKDYIDSINKIKVGDDMKKETLNKMKEIKKGFQVKPKKTYRYATAMIIFILMVSIAIPLGFSIKEDKENPIQQIAKTGDLPTVDSFDNLYDILQLGKNYNSYNNPTKGTLDLGMIAENSADSLASSERNVSDNKEISEYSKTNTQVEGVDEADIVKTDGEYIYYVSVSKVVIVDAKNPEDLKIVNEIEYVRKDNKSFSPSEVYINGNRLIVIGTEYEYSNYSVYPDEMKTIDIAVNSIDYINSKAFTVAKVYNIKNKEKVNLEREVEIEGYYLTSRMIGEELYLLANQSIYSYNYYKYEKSELDENQFKPEYRDTAVSDEVKCLNFQDIYYCPGSKQNTYLNIAGFNVNNKREANIESVLGAGQNVYCSEDNLYVSNTKYEYKNSIIFGSSNEYKVTTEIYKFRLNNSKAIYTKVGTVPGEIINQFSMDEKDRYFRIATTDRTTWSSNSSTNNLYILNENMEIIGQVENLAKGESIYSVRFMGNRAYVVTFVQVDPLFVIDLSDPTNPKVLGELKIPGYSKYLHPYDENYIIGFGEDIQTINYGYGDVTKTTGMKMALFDVTDPKNPKEMYSVKIGDRGTYSELLYNHKALLFSKEKDIIAFPITISEDVSNYKSNLKFQGAIVYGLDLEKGFTLKGQIAHMQVDSGYRNYDYIKAVERIIYINDSLYTLSKGLIKSTDMNTMKEQDNVEIKVNQSGYIVY